MKTDTICISKCITKGMAESQHMYINRVRVTVFEVGKRNITTLENMPTPSLRSHLNSSPMGVFLKEMQ